MPSKIPSSQVEPSSGPLGLRTSTCRSWPTPGTTSCSSTPSTPPGRSSSCSRRIQAMRGKQAAPLVRVAGNHAYQICFALDAGARGIVVPMVNTRAEAEAAVRGCRYHPLGNRSNAGVRGEWGEFKNYRDYLDAVNNGLLIVPMIETNQSLENLDT